MNTTSFTRSGATLFCLAGLGLAYTHAQGSMTQTISDSIVYKVTFFGDLIVSEDRILSHSMMQGRGQRLIENGLVTTGEFVEKTATNISVSVDDKTLTFKTAATTKVCDGKKKIALGDLATGDMITVVSKKAGALASSIRKGPMLFTGLGGAMELKVYKCAP